MGEAGRNLARVLLVAPIMPSDRGNGLAMRAGFFLDSYARRFEVDLVVVPLAGGAKEPTPFVGARARRAAVLRTAMPDTHFRLIAGIADAEARLAAFRQYGRPSITSTLSEEVEAALREFAGETGYALIHVFRLYLAGLAQAWIGGTRRVPLVLDCDEDDAVAYRRLAGLYRKWGMCHSAAWADAEANGFAKLASHWLPRANLLLAASTSEASSLAERAGKVPVNVVPNVVPTAAIAPAGRSAQARDVLFVGNMGYFPNIDAVVWFGSQIWPMLRRMVTRPVRFVIAGSGAPAEVTALGRRPGIVLAGNVEDLGPLYRQAALAIVPIRAGGGTRIKLLEAAGYGVPVVATRFGAAGSGLRSGHELLLADSARDFAAACARLLTEKGLASQLAARARKVVVGNYAATRWSDHLLRLVGGRADGAE